MKGLKKMKKILDDLLKEVDNVFKQIKALKKIENQ